MLEDRQPDVAPAVPAEGTVLLDGLRVLLVEDEEDARELLVQLVAEWGAEVRGCGTAAEALRERAGITHGDLLRGLAHHLEREHDIAVKTGDATLPSVLRRYDPQRRVVTISHALPPHSRTFQLAVQVALSSQRELIDRLAASDRLTTDESRALARDVLGNYFAGAVLMPYRTFYDAARAERYDLELLGFYGKLDELRANVRALIEQDDARARWLRDLTVFDGYHESLLEAVERALATGATMSNEEARDPDISLRAYLQWCSAQPATPQETFRAWRQGTFRFDAPMRTA